MSDVRQLIKQFEDQLKTYPVVCSCCLKASAGYIFALWRWRLQMVPHKHENAELYQSFAHLGMITHTLKGPKKNANQLEQFPATPPIVYNLKP